MQKRDVNKTSIIKKGEAGQLLGFGATAGYKYLTYLEKNLLIKPVFLPGIKTPRYKKKDILALIDSDHIEGLPEFEATQ